MISRKYAHISVSSSSLIPSLDVMFTLTHTPAISPLRKKSPSIAGRLARSLRGLASALGPFLNVKSRVPGVTREENAGEANGKSPAFVPIPSSCFYFSFYVSKSPSIQFII